MYIYEIIIGAGALACAITTIVTLVYHIRKGLKTRKKETIDQLAEAVINHATLAPVKAVSEGMCDFMATMQETATGVAEIQGQLDELAQDTKLSLYNTAARIYYEMGKQPKFSNGMYKDFSATVTRYKKRGGNGEVKGFCKDLEDWRSTGVKPAHFV
jgi:hypothetical protein